MKNDSHSNLAKNGPKKDPFLTLQPASFALGDKSLKGDEQFERQFMEEVLSADPCNEEALMVLGHAYTRMGDYAKGLAIDQRLARLRPADPTVYYNLACSFSLLRQVDDAFVALEKAISLGYRDFAHILKDEDLANLRNDQRFRNLSLKLLPGTQGNS